MADRAQAAEILRNALARRLKLARFEDKNCGLVAIATFQEYSQGTVEHLLDIGKTPNEITIRICQPEFWECGHKRAQSAQRAIDLVVAERRLGAEQRAASSANGLCVLKGTPKQVAWATALRAAHLQKRPDSEHKEVASAAWWIKNRGAL